ncbi:MAG: hypothetical protein GWP10_10400 [Nitrospiraceae bacterium]|nr:hypothetical protein [Nitrospiraceae bacterium]
MKFKCKVITRSSRNEIVGLNQLKQNKFDFGDDENLPLIKAYITAAPVKGKANKELVKLLANELGVSKSGIRILKGEKRKEKILEIGN